MVQRCASGIAQHAGNGTLLRLVVGFFRSLVFWLTWLCFLLVIALWSSMRWIGEQNITTAFLLFLPPLGWLLPAILLLLPALFFNWRCLCALLVLVVLIGWGWLSWRSPVFRSATNSSSATLTVMTYNRGQSRNQSLQPFKQATLPDVLVMQDAANRVEGYLRSTDYAEFPYGAGAGEHLILSKNPVKEALLLPPASPRRQSRAARFVIEWQGRLVSIYSVHLMTPRDALHSYSRGAFLWGVLAFPGTSWAAKRQHYQEFWDGQIADARAILDAVRADPNPSVIAGDFNSPHLGYTHQMITRELGDSHAESGSGFGFTFPGDTRNPLSLRGPWLRIDYVFHDHRWLAVECITERDRPSQHRAVVAKLCLVQSPSG